MYTQLIEIQHKSSMNSGAFHFAGVRETNTQLIISVHWQSPGLESPRRELNCSISFKLKGSSMLSSWRAALKEKWQRCQLTYLLTMQILKELMWAAHTNEVAAEKSALPQPFHEVKFMLKGKVQVNWTFEPWSGWLQAIGFKPWLQTNEDVLQLY